MARNGQFDKFVTGLATHGDVVVVDALNAFGFSEYLSCVKLHDYLEKYFRKYRSEKLVIMTVFRKIREFKDYYKNKRYNDHEICDNPMSSFFGCRELTMAFPKYVFVFLCVSQPYLVIDHSSGYGLCTSDPYREKWTHNKCEIDDYVQLYILLLLEGRSYTTSHDKAIRNRTLREQLNSYVKIRAIKMQNNFETEKESFWLKV